MLRFATDPIVKVRLDQRDRAAVGLIALETGLPEQVARDHAVHDLQHGRHQLGVCGQQSATAQRILTHLALPAEVPTPAPARAPPIGHDDVSPRSSAAAAWPRGAANGRVPRDVSQGLNNRNSVTFRPC